MGETWFRRDDWPSCRVVLMASSSLSPSEGKRIAEAVASAADEFLVSYIILARFEECGPHSVGFTMAHCLELSIKAVYWHIKKQAPPFNHRVDELIEDLRAELGAEFLAQLPDSETREKFKNRVDDMNTAGFMNMLESYFDINPNFDDDKWMVLYALFRPVHIKYGYDKQPAIIQLMQPDKLRLNKMALRLIGHARQKFPSKDSHQDVLRKFVARLPKRRTIIDALLELTRTGSAYYSAKDQEKAEGPFPRMTFDREELDLLKEALFL